MLVEFSIVLWCKGLYCYEETADNLLQETINIRKNKEDIKLIKIMMRNIPQQKHSMAYDW